MVKKRRLYTSLLTDEPRFRHSQPPSHLDLQIWKLLCGLPTYKAVVFAQHEHAFVQASHNKSSLPLRTISLLGHRHARLAHPARSMPSDARSRTRSIEIPHATWRKLGSNNAFSQFRYLAANGRPQSGSERAATVPR